MNQNKLMKLKHIQLNYPTANNKNKYKMKQFYYFKHFLLSFCLMAFSVGLQAQTTYDWLNTAPDGNFRQGISAAWWSGGFFD
jgi:hypothetical protein